MFNNFTRIRRIEALRNFTNTLTTMRRFYYVCDQLKKLANNSTGYSELSKLQEISAIAQRRSKIALRNNDIAMYKNHPTGMKSMYDVN